MTISEETIRRNELFTKHGEQVMVFNQVLEGQYYLLVTKKGTRVVFVTFVDPSPEDRELKVCYYGFDPLYDRVGKDDERNLAVDEKHNLLPTSWQLFMLTDAQHQEIKKMKHMVWLWLLQQEAELQYHKLFWPSENETVDTSTTASNFASLSLELHKKAPNLFDDMMHQIHADKQALFSLLRYWKHIPETKESDEFLPLVLFYIASDLAGHGGDFDNYCKSQH